MPKQPLNQSDLDQFTGTETHWKNPLHGLIYTDGAKFVAENAGAYWLLDEIAFAQRNARVTVEKFQVWTLSVDLTTHQATLSCEDGNGNAVFSKSIPFTDFPNEKISLWFAGGVLLLPSEY